MKILYLATDVFSKGGIPRYSRYQIRALRENFGEENVHVYSLHAPYKFDNYFEDKIHVNYVQGGIKITDKIKFIKKVLYAVKNLHFDIIINNHIQLSFVSYLAKKFFRTKFITNIYGLEVWSGLRVKDKIGFLNSDLIIGDCNFILDYVRKNFSGISEKLRLLHDPVDIDRFKPLPKDEKLCEKYNIPKDKFILMTLGRLERDKGFELVIRTLKYLPSQLIYVIVGDGKYKGHLKALTIKEGVHDRVFFTGRVPEDDLVGIYNVCDIFILVSRFGKGEGEGLPLALIEASACAKPIIAGNEDGSIDAVEDGKNGFIISPYNLDGLVAKIKILYENENLRLNMGEYSRIKVTRDFSYEKFKLRLESIIKDV